MGTALSPDTDDRWLTEIDIATRMGVSRQAVIDLIESGQLAAVRVPGERRGWRIRESEYRRLGTAAA